MSIRKNLLQGIVFLTAFVFLMAVAGCGDVPAPAPQESPQKEEEERPQEVGPPATMTATLYFASEQGDKLVKEKRVIEVIDREPGVVILEELIKGPHAPELGRTIPDGVKVLGFLIENGIAVADFSEEISTNHWGGSTGEILTVFSIVNTLTELSEVEQVRFLIEGEEIETLVGHLDLSAPVHPDEGLLEN